MTAQKSQILTNLATTPTVMTKIREKHGRVRMDVCRFTVAATPGAGHFVGLTRLKAHDAIVSIRHIGDADAQFDDCNIGIYTPNDGTTVTADKIDDNGLVEAINISGADLIPTEILGTGVTNPEDFGKALWEYCGGGPATEPEVGTEYDIVLEIISNAAGSDHTIIIEYLAGD